ncbi:type VI secretion system baseplate subunit TssG [Pseudomonas sp. TTU2014-080ASC]|uniref:type VI secretion system baseplate subunit TssG n=1 Tax=Pseudomonas sp. TTU2014-080ASC TaxID=1729724 RepID=UPI0007187D0B|nr:type VI secretion system baseplate subunit TssG [Pseudomonas sp. TTU2014-080ASC]KRW62600.1 type VI secretion protein [Pseudomonas sp. TTU2014-080ASC]
MHEMSLIQHSEPAPLLEQQDSPDKSPALKIQGLSNRQDFFELLRRIERAQPDAPRLGVSNDRSHERLNITQPADLAFASREVVDVEQKPPKVIIKARHFGMFAPYGPLPIHVTEHARSEDIAKRNKAFQQFVSIMSQRFAVLHYRAWSQLNTMAGHDHDDQKNPFLCRLWQAVGVTPGVGTNPHVQRLRAAYGGAYLPGRRSLRQLQKILAAYFLVPVQITPRHAQWVNDGKQTGNQKLGALGKTRVGSRFFDAQYGAHIDIGPLPSSQYQQYQRGSVRLQALVNICHDFMCHQLVLDISLLIHTEPEMAMQLGNKRLSKDGWLKPKTGTYKQQVYQSAT